MKPLPGINDLLQANSNSCTFVWRGRNPYQAQKSSSDEGGDHACRSTHHRLNAWWPRPIGRPPKPSPDRSEEEETNIPDQRGYLLAPLPGDRARRPSVQNLYMAAKIKLKLFEGSSLRFFTKQTIGTPPSFPANIKELLHEELSDEQQNEAKALGIYPIENFKRRHAAAQL